MAWTSSHEPVEVGGTTLDRLVLAAAGRARGRPALIEGETGASVSYGELAARIGSVAGALRCRRGEVLALWAPNVPAWPAVAFGAMAAGLTVTTANPAYTERELATQLADSGARLVAAVPRLRDTAAAAGAPAVITLEELAGPGPAAGPRRGRRTSRCCRTPAARPACPRA